MTALEIALKALEEIHAGAFSPTGVATAALADIAAQASPVVQDSQSAFESWAISEDGQYCKRDLVMVSSGSADAVAGCKYKHHGAQREWEVWQAGRASVAVPADLNCRWPMCESKAVQEQAALDAVESMFGTSAAHPVGEAVAVLVSWPKDRIRPAGAEVLMLGDPLLYPQFPENTYELLGRISQPPSSAQAATGECAKCTRKASEGWALYCVDCLRGFFSLDPNGAQNVRDAALDEAIASVPGGSICDPQQVADAIRTLKSQPAPPVAQTVGDAVGINEVPHLIFFDDRDRPPELLIGRERALLRYAQISASWNAHLFVKIDSNSRDCRYPSATPIAPPVAQDQDTSIHDYAKLREACSDVRARQVQDARRYQWLRHGDNDELVIQHGPVAPGYHWLPRNERLDAMIDAAIQAGVRP